MKFEKFFIPSAEPDVRLETLRKTQRGKSGGLREASAICWRSDDLIGRLWDPGMWS